MCTVNRQSPNIPDKNKQMVPPEPMSEEELFFEEANLTASATECTGLMPTPPISPEEAESYTDIYSIPQPITQKHNHLQQEEGTNNPQNP